MLTPYAATIDGLPHDALGRIALSGSSEEDTEMDELDETNKLDEINKLNEPNKISCHFPRLPNEIWDMIASYFVEDIEEELFGPTVQLLDKGMDKASARKLRELRALNKSFYLRISPLFARHIQINAARAGVPRPFPLLVYLTNSDYNTHVLRADIATTIGLSSGVMPCLRKLPNVRALNYDYQVRESLTPGEMVYICNIVMRTLYELPLLYLTELRISFPVIEDNSGFFPLAFSMAHGDVSHVLPRLTNLEVSIPTYRFHDIPMPAGALVMNRSFSAWMFWLVHCSTNLQCLTIRSSGGVLDLDWADLEHLTKLRVLRLEGVCLSAATFGRFLSLSYQTLHTVELTGVALHSCTWERVLWTLVQLPGLLNFRILDCAYSAQGASRHRDPPVLTPHGPEVSETEAAYALRALMCRVNANRLGLGMERIVLWEIL
ncbi:hypothetical protein ASPACDRAFT_64684 [Aspergillus aculeatus ATCC 16872]|uniref:Uncharacterized protein n=1 Tax=Aspergillus aculeatus (strain ATCC 16872 / CBS 172.66 / WB 5094) TaxID=690307 RepID=A0A1L9WG45_ASPA1|nr:uncharacterized protein ASPACDRAFT_64684 [Aspergillus aculeatus ATCC 16872]OJJ95077.1 hypothetical protein ASPACDRAFT_64684 [Aspergillus aculeatus ATCC 16872]